MLGKIEGRRRRGTTEDEIVGWHHLFNGHEHTPGDGEGQGRLACCSPWCHKESNKTEQQQTGNLEKRISVEKASVFLVNK